jgi:hypothetical protein
MTGRCVADEVEKVDPGLGNCDRYCEVQTVRYGAVNATFLKEFLRERRRVKTQDAIIVQQHKQIEALTAALQKMKRAARTEQNRTANG